MTELQALQNALNYTELPGLTVHEKQYEDKRKKVKMYFVQLNKTTISPTLNYENMNSFILGFIRALIYSHIF